MYNNILNILHLFTMGFTIQDWLSHIFCRFLAKEIHPEYLSVHCSIHVYLSGV